MTFWETIERGEYVMIALAVIFVIVILIWSVRGGSVAALGKKYSWLMHRVRDMVVEGDLENARQLCEGMDSPGARLIHSGLNRVGQPMSEVRESMAQVAAGEKAQMWRGSGWLKTFAVISPLLGLGGTLTGVIDRLRDLGNSQLPVDTAMVCETIAPTIVTTVAGLGVGIFSLISLAFLEGVINKAQRKLDDLGLEFIQLLQQPA